ncbi:MAG: hypothetical protein ABJG41_19580 [Cyclobacteriaceae bacterium]
MDNPRELYHEEIKKLQDFRSRLESHSIYKEQLDEFSDDYEELVAQAKVITRVSDRLQKKLDSANLQIRSQNEEIKDKNVKLTETIDELAKAKVGRKAATIMLVVALVLFVLEQIIVQPYIEENFAGLFYLDYILLGGIFFLVKFFESRLEGYFVDSQKRKIIEEQEKQGTLEFSESQKK